MKKIFLFLAIPLLFFSCNNEDENNYDEVIKALTEYNGEPIYWQRERSSAIYRSQFFEDGTIKDVEYRLRSDAPNETYTYAVSYKILSENEIILIGAYHEDGITYTYTIQNGVLTLVNEFSPEYKFVYYQYSGDIEDFSYFE